MFFTQQVWLALKSFGSVTFIGQFVLIKICIPAIYLINADKFSITMHIIVIDVGPWGRKLDYLLI